MGGFDGAVQAQPHTAEQVAVHVEECAPVMADVDGRRDHVASHCFVRSGHPLSDIGSDFLSLSCRVGGRTVLHSTQCPSQGYPVQFAEHAIGQQPWGEQENILCYAFFLQIVQDEGYTAARLRELSAYSDLTVAPAKPALSQNLGFVSLFALIVGLSTELIKATSFFLGGKGAVILILVAAVSFIYWIVWDGIQSTPYQRLRIKRYVDLAAYDLEERVQDVRELNPVESSPVLSMSKQTEPTA
ncbi:hypothetical protein [Pseudomonas sp. CFBP13508]|uniref:hypothetical protein n=1 Tax=Pseudomonas sp. CFBP13508 TaxID=2184009 RepID=UPI001F4FAD4D|nr:hypothetical protein [Pseudomonas sp. CFBP13508]